MLRTRIFLTAAISTIAVAMLGVACGSNGKGSGFDDGSGDGGSGDGSTGQFGADGGDGSTQCIGLQCKKVSCPGGGTTTISGQVFDPMGLNPLYDVAVYVPSTMPLADIPSGVTCDHCGSTLLNPAASALTDEDGKFQLTDVPVDKAIPVVIQVGKWRRTFTIDVNQCADNPMPAPLTLPKNGSEGDMPQMAVAVNGYDALECLLYGMGVDESEFVTGAATGGHIHQFSSGQNATLWASEATLTPYDITLLDCEGEETPGNKSDAILQGMHDYAGHGGKIFATHYHYVWFKGSSSDAIAGGNLHAPSDFVGTANWNSHESAGAGGSATFDVNQSFPKGASFATWLMNVGASTTPGKITLKDYSNTVNSVNSPTTGWISNGSNTEYMSFNAPVGAADADQCGKVVFTDLHVTSSAVNALNKCKFQSSTTGDRSKGLTPQQKALEFLFFDLSSCVTNDSNPPPPPR